MLKCVQLMAATSNTDRPRSSRWAERRQVSGGTDTHRHVARPEASGAARAVAERLARVCLPGGRESTHTQRGFALLIVLWILVLLALLVTQLTVAGRVEARIAANLRSGAAAEAAADGAVYEALFHLLDGSARHWNIGGAPHQVRIANGVVLIRIRSEAGKVNPNTASEALLAALLRNVGADPQRAAAVAAAIINWRTPGLLPQLVVATTAEYRAAGREYGPPGSPFQSLDELGLVLGMTPELLERLIPHLSIYQDSNPVPVAADPIVLKAITEAAGADSGAVGLGNTGAAPAVSITAEVREADGSSFIRHAIIRIQPTADGRPYQILAWGTPAS